jgi:hypothetical protein
MPWITSSSSNILTVEELFVGHIRTLLESSCDEEQKRACVAIEVILPALPAAFMGLYDSVVANHVKSPEPVKL